jgi:hypothetical protein
MKILYLIPNATARTDTAGAFEVPDAQEVVTDVSHPRDGVGLIGAVGSFPALGNESPANAPRLTLTMRLGWGETVDDTLIDSWTDLVSVIDRIAFILDSGELLLHCQLESGTIRHAWAKVVSYRRPSTPLTRRLVEITAVLEMYEGIWYSRSNLANWNLDDGFYLDAGLSLDNNPIFYLEDGDSFQIDYDGSADALLMNIVLHSYSGTVTDPKITNNTTGESMQWTGTLDATDLDIDTYEMSITHGVSDEYDNLTLGTNQVRWMSLRARQTNLLGFECSGGGIAHVEFAVLRQFRMN